MCIYRQAQEKQQSLNLWDPLSFPQGKRKLLCRAGVTVTAAGSCSELGLQTEQTLGMRTHRPTHYKSAPEILPTEVFCLHSCAGKQGGVSVLQGTKGEAQMEVLPCAVVAKLPHPALPGLLRNSPELCSLHNSIPNQAFAILCPAPRRAFLCYSKEPGSPGESPELQSRSAWPVTWEEQSN